MTYHVSVEKEVAGDVETLSLGQRQVLHPRVLHLSQTCKRSSPKINQKLYMLGCSEFFVILACNEPVLVVFD